MPHRLFDMMLAHADAKPHEAVIREIGGEQAEDETRCMTWVQLRTAAIALAAELRGRLSDGAVVMLAAGHDATFYIGFLAALAADCEVFAVAPELTPIELERAAEQSGAAAVLGTRIVCEAMASRVAYTIDLSSTDWRASRCDTTLATEVIAAHRGSGALLLQSAAASGATQIVRRSAESLAIVANNLTAAIGLRPTDRVLMTLPLHHSYGLEHGLLMPLAAGASVELMSGFDPYRLVNLLDEREITILPGVPFMYESMLIAAESVMQLRRVYSAGAPLPRSIFDAFEQWFDCRIGQVYGSTEFGSATFNDPDAADFDPTSVGKPLSGVRVRIHADDGNERAIGEVGRIAIASASMMTGYVGGGNDDASPLQNGWLTTGDFGYVDDRGRLFITRAAPHLINISGRKIHPAEVERVLCEHPAVAAARVRAAVVTPTVSRLTATVVLKDGAATDAAALRSFLRQRLVAYKIPRQIEIRSELPAEEDDVDRGLEREAMS